MATVIRRAESRFWIACFTDRAGRQLKRSTKTSDRNQALQIAVELERAERQAKSGELVTTQLRKVLSDVAEKVNGDRLDVPTTADYLRGWLDGIKARRAPGTLERYSNTVRLFLQYLGPRSSKPITGVTPTDLEGFLNSRLNSGCAPATAIVDVKTLKGAFRRAENFGIILKNPVTPIQLPKNTSSEREVFTQAEVQQLIDSAPSTDWQTLILFGYFTGARLRDCANMKWENVSPTDGMIVYQQQKTGKTVMMPMHYHILEHLTELGKSGTAGNLCPTLAGKSSGGKTGLSEGFKQIVITAGIDPGVIQGKGLRKFSKRSFHSLRHSINSVMTNAGVAQELRMKMIGHMSKTINDRYSHVEIATLKNAMTSIPLFAPKAEAASA